MTHKPLSVLVVDDEAPARARLSRLLEEFDNFMPAGEAANGIEALHMYEELQPDIVLLDIRMPGMDGIEAGRHLAQLETPPAVIFTTAFNEYAIDAFDAQAVGYLLKPVRKEKLERALEHASRLSRTALESLGSNTRLTTRRTHLSARIGERLRLVPWEEILYFQADQKYVAIGLAGEEVLIDDSLKALEDEFDELLLRVHRNALIVVRHLRGIERQPNGGYICVIDGTDKHLAISRRHLSAIRKLIKSRR